MPPRCAPHAQEPPLLWPGRPAHQPPAPQGGPRALLDPVEYTPRTVLDIPRVPAMNQQLAAQGSQGDVRGSGAGVTPHKHSIDKLPPYVQ